MPINDYRCTRCGYTAEDIDDKVYKRFGLGKCPQCGYEDWAKLLPRTSFRIKGQKTEKFYERS